MRKWLPASLESRIPPMSLTSPNPMFLYGKPQFRRRGRSKNHTGPDHYADSGFEQAFQGGHGVDRFGYSMRSEGTIADNTRPHRAIPMENRSGISI